MPSADHPRTPGEPRILLVEDDGITARYISQCLRRAGYPPPRVSASAEEALTLASDQRPDVVLMDIVLRGEMDGIEAAGLLRRQLDASVVFLTARTDEPSQRRVAAVGADGVLAKPFLERELCAAVGRALRSLCRAGTACPHEGSCTLADRLGRRAGALAEARRRAEASLDESRRLLDGFLRAVPAMLYAYDMRAGRTILASRRVEPYLGQPLGVPEDCAAGAWPTRVHPDDRDAAEQHQQQLRRAADGEVIESTLRLRHRDGDWHWLRLHDVVSARDAPGEPTCVVGIAEDVTEQRTAQETMARAAQLAEVGKLAVSLAHEINNPLQSVLGCLDLLREALAQGGEPGRYLEVARREVRRAARLAGQLRSLGRPSRGPADRAQTDLAEIASGVVALIERRCSRQGVHVIWAPPDTPPSVLADPDAIQQVFLNLALNALDAMPDGGSLRIAISADDRDGFRVTFTDNGPGIDPDLVPRLFDSFVSTKPDGLGLGLYISRDIVARHGGHIEVDTRPGHGTTFTVWLPMLP